MAGLSADGECSDFKEMGAAMEAVGEAAETRLCVAHHDEVRAYHVISHPAPAHVDPPRYNLALRRQVFFAPMNQLIIHLF